MRQAPTLPILVDLLGNWELGDGEWMLMKSSVTGNENYKRKWGKNGPRIVYYIIVLIKQPIPRFAHRLQTALLLRMNEQTHSKPTINKDYRKNRSHTPLSFSPIILPYFPIQSLYFPSQSPLFSISDHYHFAVRSTYAVFSSPNRRFSYLTVVFPYPIAIVLLCNRRFSQSDHHTPFFFPNLSAIFPYLIVVFPRPIAVLS